MKRSGKTSAMLGHIMATLKPGQKCYVASIDPMKAYTIERNLDQIEHQKALPNVDHKKTS